MDYLIAAVVGLAVILIGLTLTHFAVAITPAGAVEEWRNGAYPTSFVVTPEPPLFERLPTIGGRESFTHAASCTFAGARVKYAVAPSGRSRLTFYALGDLVGSRFYYEKSHRFAGHAVGWNKSVIVTPIDGEMERYLTALLIAIRDETSRKRQRASA